MKTPADRAAGDLERRVLRFIREGNLLRRGATVVVAVSGGPDSLCLLHLLARLSERLDVRLHVAHLDHMLRGAASAGDAAFVAGEARNLGLPCTVEARDVTAWKRRRRCSLEEAAREVRYRFLYEVACSAGADAVATGHTRDDAVETLLLHLMRGSGLQGLRGLEPASSLPVTAEGPAVDSVRIVRPLLLVSRDETLGYCRLLGLAPRQDTSNESLSHLRNRIRLELLPQCRGLNPRFDDALLRLADAARLDDDHLEREAATSFECISEVSTGRVRLDLAGFAATSPALQSRMVRMACGKVAGDIRDLSTAHVRAVRRLVAARPGKRVSLVSGIVWLREKSALVAASEPADGGNRATAAALEPVAVPVPGDVTLPGWKVTACLVDSPSPQPNDDAFTAVLDAAVAGGRLFVRWRQPGDRFRPLGMASEKKLQDFMVDAGVPLAERDSVPLLCSPEHIVWVVGWRIDDRVKVSAGTRSGLRVTFSPAE